MFSLLQSLHILPGTAIPAASSFIPFAQNSLIQIPHPPNEISLSSVVEYGFRLLTAPHIMIYAYVYLRPIIEGRLYRLLRRRLPKPDRPDKLSIRSAVDNELIEWTVPSLGRRSEEEKTRSELYLLDEIIFEFTVLKNWIRGFFKWERTGERPGNGRDSWSGRHELLQNRAEQVQGDSNVGEASGRPPAPRIASPPPARPLEAQDDWRHSESAVTADPAIHSTPNQAILPDEEQRMMQSPLQLPEEYFRPMANAASIVENRPAPPVLNYQAPARAVENSHQQSSRTNTLFSRTSSPESSPLTSPRVRASLVHQNSDIITMQLELLQSRRNGNAPTQNNNNNNNDSNSTAPAPPPIQRTEQNNDAGDIAVDQEAAELIDALLSRQLQEDGQHEESSNNDPNATSNRDLPAATDSDPSPRQAEELTRMATDGTADPIVPSAPDAHPGRNETSNANTARDNQTDESSRVLPISTNSRRTFLTDRLFPYHRVTILSAHPVDSLASHVATLVTTVLFYPLESLYLRHLAYSFLSSRAVQTGAMPLGVAASSLGLQRHLRPVGGWFEGGGKGDILSYVSKMILVTGIQAAVSAGIWSLGTTATVLLGRRKFGWGNL